MERSSLRHNIIYICGPDGSGKSTLSRQLVKTLAKRNIKTTYRWMRFNHITSKLVNAIGRLSRLSQKVTYNGNVIVGYHLYYKSALISWLYILSTIIDLYLVYPFKIFLPIIGGRVVVIDRFVYDILVDLMVDTRITNLHERWPGNILRMAIPVNSVCFFLDVDIDTIRDRRPDTAYDRTQKQRCELYKILSKDLNIHTLNNNLEVESTLTAILEKIN